MPAPTLTRRRLLAAVAGSTTAVTAGCLNAITSGSPDCGFIDEAAATEAAFAWDDLDDLEGELVVYAGRTSDQINPLFRCIETHYDDFEVRTDYDDNQTQLNVLTVEGAHTEADLFYSQSSSALARLAEEGLAAELDDRVLDAVDPDIRDPDGRWVATSGRVRAVQYHTGSFSADELPTDILDYAEDDRFAGRIATRPNSGSFRAFIAAMLAFEGEARTREWIRGLLDDQDVELYGSGSAMARAVADGDVDVGLGNQYYAGRLVENDSETPIGVTYTQGDAGALFNVSGVAVTAASDRSDLATTFIEHLLAAEGQQFFVAVNGEYPVIDGVEYVGDLPGPDELDAPAFDLSQTADLTHVVDLLREEGMTV